MITVVINNRNLLTWPRAMVEHIYRFVGLYEIVILDNASTYQPLQRWYATLPCRVIQLGSNMGHTAPWTPLAQSAILTDQYVVTDPDLDLAGVPRDVLAHLAALLDRFPQYGKMGLSLETKDYGPGHPYHKVNGHIEAICWAKPLLEGAFRAAPIDTTFALYDKRVMNEYKICGARTDRPYTCRHLPWYIQKPDAEFAYYLQHANSSSSYKTHAR